MATAYRFARKALLFNTALLLLMIAVDLLFFAPDTDSKASPLTITTPENTLRWRNMMFGTVFGVDIILFGAWMFTSGQLDAEREQRRRLGLCLTCGYDIRASGDYCSECGQFINLDERGNQL